MYAIKPNPIRYTGGEANLSSFFSSCLQTTNL